VRKLPPKDGHEPEVPPGSSIAPVNPDAGIPHGAGVGDIFPDQFGAMVQWKAEGGEGSGLKVTPV
jgi:hypothetical protein